MSLDADFGPETQSPAEARRAALSQAALSQAALSQAALSQAELSVDLGAIVANWRKLQNMVGNATCSAVVKANAYGLGLEKVAPALWAAGCKTYFVAQGAEGLALRRLLPEAEIFVLHGLSDHVTDFPDADLVPALNRLEEIAAWGRCAKALGRRLPAALHIDTGMTRLGLSEADARLLAERPGLLDGLEVRLVMSHLACADEPAHPMNASQRDAFRRLLPLLPAARASLSSSGGIFQGTGFHFDMVRPGIALYGGNPLAEGANPMAPVARLRAKILQVHDVDTPQTVGYGATYRLAGPARIATIAVGYADGYPRSLGNRGFAFIDGVRVPVVGRVSMDLITLDVTGLAPEQAAVGSVVDLLGGPADLDALAAAADTVAYEILTRLGPRYRRLYQESREAELTTDEAAGENSPPPDGGPGEMPKAGKMTKDRATSQRRLRGAASNS